MFYVLLTAFAAAIAIADQLTKVLAQQHLTGTTITLVPGWLQLHYITNDGMALSLFRGGRWMFVVLTAVYLQFLQYNIWLVFLIGVPVQLICILWLFIRHYK